MLRNVQEAVIGFLTAAAGVAAGDATLTGFGAVLFLALFLKEHNTHKRRVHKMWEFLPYGLFVAGYIGGGYHFIQTYFLPEMQIKAIAGLGVLACAQIVKGYYERAVASKEKDLGI